ncbi:MAG TPA: MFS transporter [Rhizomicrobium sp.]|nr:MFS transporter [Rhizomicrobium sp.]
MCRANRGQGRALDKLYEGLETDAEREAAYEGFVWRNLKRNYAGHYVHGMLGLTGFRLVNAPTFVPAYLHRLSGSDVAVGLGLALQQFGGAVSPIFGAAHIEHRRHVLPISMILGSLMRVAVLGLALSGWLLHGAQLLASVMIFLFLLGLFSGPQNVAFQFLLGKMIPIRWRGRLQGWRNMTGGLIAALLSYFAGKYLVGANVWGNGYGTTFLVAFVLTSLGLTAFRFLVREPEPPTVRPRMEMRERLRDLPRMLGDDPHFRWFMIARTFAIASRVAAPFYIVYASKAVAMTGNAIGTLSFAYLIADTILNLVWGYMADKLGFRSCFVAALVFWIAATALLMGAHTMPVLFVAFFGLGAANSGYQMSAQNIVFEFGRREDMAMRLAVSNTAESIMAALGPLLGGFIAASLGYRAVFAVSIVFETIALVLLVRFVEEPRKRRAAIEAERDAAMSLTSTTSVAQREAEQSGA